MDLITELPKINFLTLQHCVGRFPDATDKPRILYEGGEFCF